MSDEQVVVPAIPEICRNKKFGATDIKWVKTVNHPPTSRAYIIPPDACNVVSNSDGVFFCLKLNPKFTDTLNSVRCGELILLYQKLDRQHTKCFTHLVTPIGTQVVRCPYPTLDDYWPGRWVKVIAMTGYMPGESIPLYRTSWPTAGFTGQYQDLSFQNGMVREIPYIPGLAELQAEIWGRFRPYLK
jgi:hypothetical protein